MQLSAPNVRVAAVETCDFGLLRQYETEELLRAALPGRWRRYLGSSITRAFIGRLGVETRHLSHVPGRPLACDRLTAMDLARSAVERLALRHPSALDHLDALIFVSTSNPNPCNSQAALLAREFGIAPSCFDLKAGCSGGVLGLIQGALLIGAGCDRVLVVMAENLSQLTSEHDLRMLLTVGDGAACVLLERATGPGFLAMLHGTAPGFASALTVRATFPPAPPVTRYAYEPGGCPGLPAFLAERWQSVFAESLALGGVTSETLGHWFFHQTHGEQVDQLTRRLGGWCGRAPSVVTTHGNMGTPTFAVAMAQGLGAVQPGERYLIQAVGGGVSWAAIMAEHG
jgi:3-oxoacyl-[acyl-carrier-protein] synthase-3